jgi:hypothetical protein
VALNLRHRVAGCFFACAAACACSKSEPAPAKRTAPWPAREQPEATPATRAALMRFAIDARTLVRFELKGSVKTQRGSLRVARGELEVDLLDLTRTRGNVSVDVASALMEGEDPEQARENTRSAQNWLDVGASRPEAERDRLRWATFSILGLEKLSSETAHEGQLVKTFAADAGNALDTDGATEAGTTEVRSVTMTARGRLLLHGFRVDQSAELRALFFYPGPAGPDIRPDRLVIQTRGPFVVSLKAHDIKPRNDMGVFVAQDAKLLGREVGSQAQVHVDLSARPAP